MYPDGETLLTWIQPGRAKSKKSKTQLLVESLAVAQATPVPTLDMLDDKELAGGSSPTRCSSLVVGLDLTAKMRKPCGADGL